MDVPDVLARRLNALRNVSLLKAHVKEVRHNRHVGAAHPLADFNSVVEAPDEVRFIAIEGFKQHNRPDFLGIAPEILQNFNEKFGFEFRRRLIRA